MVQEVRPTAIFMLTEFPRTFLEASSEGNYEQKSCKCVLPVEDLPNHSIASSPGSWNESGGWGVGGGVLKINEAAT